MSRWVNGLVWAEVKVVVGVGVGVAGVKVEERKGMAVHGGKGRGGCVLFLFDGFLNL